MWVLVVAECASATFCGVIRGLPRWVPQKGAQAHEVVGVQVLLLSAQRHHIGRFSVSLRVSKTIELGLSNGFNVTPPMSVVGQ
jgi:hypothetical protein